jgi:hypothetical protein
MELPDPNSYEVDLVQPGFWVCRSCRRDEDRINDNIDAHIMGCAFRSRWWAIWHYNQEQAWQEAINKIEASLKKDERRCTTMTTKQNQSAEVTLTTAVSTAIEASQKLTDALKAIATFVSTDGSKKQTTTTASLEKESEMAKTSGGQPLTKKKPGRPTKTASAREATTTPKRKPGRPIPRRGPAPDFMSNRSDNCVINDEVSKAVSRGASPEVLAKARAARKAVIAKKKEQMGDVEVAEVPASGWPFPTSTRYNKDGTEKRRTEEVSCSDN